MDLTFPPRKAKTLYSIWVREDLKKNRVYVARPPKNSSLLAGYVTCQRSSLKFGQIGLLGVLPKFQGKGWGKELLFTALRWFKQQSCTRVLVTTQATNRLALRLYLSAGFRFYRRDECYHWWINQPNSAKRPINL